MNLLDKVLEKVYFSKMIKKIIIPYETMKDKKIKNKLKQNYRKKVKNKLGWFEKSPERKAELCKSCQKVYKSEKKFEICKRCGHLYIGENCSCSD